MTVTWNGDIVVLEDAKSYGHWVVERFDSLGQLQMKRWIPYVVKAPSLPLVTLRDISCNNSGGLYIAGHFKADSLYVDSTLVISGTNNSDGFILTMDTAGIMHQTEVIRNTMIWRMEGDHLENQYVLCLCNSNTLTVRNATVLQQYGSNYSHISYYVAKLNKTGGCNWIREIERYGNFDDDLYYDMDVMPAGEFFITGKTLGNLYLGNTMITASPGIFVMKADSAGGYTWLKQAVCTSTTYNSFQISACSNHAVYISGVYSNQLHAGNHQLNGSYEQFVAQLADGALTTDFSGRGELMKNEITISPNPVSDFLYIFSTAHVDLVELFDAGGRLVHKQVQANTNSIDLSGCDPGVYILRLRSGNRVYIQKVIIQ